MMQKMGLKEGEAIVHPWLNKALEKAQKKVEARNFDMRKNTLKYDDVMNDQRKEVYAQRREYMASDDVSGILAELRLHTIEDIVHAHIPEKAFAEAWDVAGLGAEIERVLNMNLPIADWSREDGMDAEGMIGRIDAEAVKAQAARTANMGPDIMRLIEKQVLLTTFDGVWKEHLHGLDQLRQGIGLRAYGQRDPLNEYKHEAFQMFTVMLDDMRLRVTQTMSRIQAVTEPAPFPVIEGQGVAPNGELSAPPAAHPDTHHPAMMPVGAEPDSDTLRRWNEGTPRNALCPCGSGQKFKHCHGRLI